MQRKDFENSKFGKSYVFEISIILDNEYLQNGIYAPNNIENKESRKAKKMV